MEKEIVKVELTIEKAKFLTTQAIMDRIKQVIGWPLATGGSRVVEIVEKKEEKV